MREKVLAGCFIAFGIAACGTVGPTDGGVYKDSAVDGPIDCSKIGCAMPPPCNQMCTAVCGCCGCPTGTLCSVCDAGPG